MDYILSHIASTSLTQLALKANAFSVITQNNGYNVRHSRSFMVADLTHSPYATSYLVSNANNIFTYLHFQIIADLY